MWRDDRHYVQINQPTATCWSNVLLPSSGKKRRAWRAGAVNGVLGNFEWGAKGSGHAVFRHGSAAARLLGLWVRIPQVHGYLSLVSVVCCQVEVSASDWSLVQRRSTECGLSEYDREASIEKPWPEYGPKRHRRESESEWEDGIQKTYNRPI